MTTHELARALARCADDPVLLVDAGVHGAPVTDRVRERLVRAGRPYRTIVLSGPGDRAGVTELAQRIGTAPVVAVGGGALLDRAKLAAIEADVPEVRRYLDVPQRSGLVVLPSSVVRRRPLVAVPTTPGTGAEVSTSACLLGPAGRYLVRGAALRPELAVVEPSAGATLPVELFGEGVLEALFRTVGPYVGDPRCMPDGDALVEDTAAALVRVGDRIAADRQADRRPAGPTFVDILRLGARSHTDRMHGGRDPFAARGWYLANELSLALGIRKTRAIAALLPPLWRAVLDGDDRLGSTPRLHRIWSHMRRAARGPLPTDPVEGITRLLDGWGLRRPVAADPARVTAAADRAVRAWGAGLPMLAGLRRDDIHALLSAAVAEPAPERAAEPVAA